MSTAPPHTSEPLNADELTARVYDIDGVTDIYPPAATVTQLPQVFTAVATGTPQRLNRVDIRTDGPRTALTVRIGVSTHAATPDTATRVADTLLKNIPPGQDSTVTVQVSRIANGPN